MPPAIPESTLPQYFAAVLARPDGQWSGREIDMASVEDLDSLVESMRDLADGGTALFFLEEDDEYLAIVRVDGDLEPRTFISDDRVVQSSTLAALVMEDILVLPESDDEEEEGIKPDPEPAGDTDIVTDLGIDADTLLDLCASEGMLPADVITAICEKAGCAEALDDLRIAL